MGRFYHNKNVSSPYVVIRLFYRLYFLFVSYFSFIFYFSKRNHYQRARQQINGATQMSLLAAPPPQCRRLLRDQRQLMKSLTKSYLPSLQATLHEIKMVAMRVCLVWVRRRQGGEKGKGPGREDRGRRRRHGSRPGSGSRSVAMRNGRVCGRRWRRSSQPWLIWDLWSINYWEAGYRCLWAVIRRIWNGNRRLRRQRPLRSV